MQRLNVIYQHKPASFLGGFGLGIKFLWFGFQSLSQKGLRRYVCLPIVFNLFFIAGLCWVFWHYFNVWLYAAMPDWLSWLWDWLLIVIHFLVGLMLLIASVIAFFFVFHLVAAPFHGLLAEKVLALVHHQSSSLPWWAFGKIMGRACGREFQKFFYFVFGVLLLFCLGWIPVVNFVGPVLWALWGMWILALEYCDFAADAQQVSFKLLRQKLFKHKWCCLGFGSAVGVVLLVPFVNLITLPAAVIGGTLLWVSVHESEGTL